MNDNIEKWRGLVHLTRDAVEQGSKAVERIQLDTARRTFDILHAIPAIATPSQVVDSVFRTSVGMTHGALRGVNQGVAKALDLALSRLGKND